MFLRGFFLASVMLVMVGPSSARETNAGLVVESVEPNEQQADSIREGDVIYGWSRGGESHSGELESPFDFWDINANQAPLGELTLKVRRGEQDMEVRLVPQAPAMDVRPHFQAEHLAHYQRGKRLIHEQRFEDGFDQLQVLANNLLRDVDTIEDGIWVLSELGKNQARHDAWEDVRATFDQAASISREHPSVVAQVLEAAGDLFERNNNYSEARVYFERALAIRRRLEPDLSLSQTYDRLGRLAYLPGDFSRAYEFYQESLDIQGLVAPDTISFAEVLNNLGRAALGAGNPAEAELYFQRAYQTASAADPNSEVYFEALRSLGSMASDHGRHAHARQYLDKARRIGAQLDPRQRARAHLTLARAALSKGQSRQANQHFAAARGMYEEAGLGRGLEYAKLLEEMSALDISQKRLKTADNHLTQALGIVADISPDKPIQARLLNRMGTLKYLRNQPVEAVGYYDQARTVIEELADEHSENSGRQAATLSQLRAYYRDHIALLVEMERNEEAFTLSEKFRARSLLTAMAEKRRDPKKTQRLRELEHTITATRNALQNQLADNEPGEIIELLGPKLTELKEEKRRLVQHLDGHRTAEGMATISHRRAQEYLAEDTALVSYLVDDQTIVILLVTAQETKAFTVANHGLARDISDFRRFIMSPKSETARRKMKGLGRKLGRILLYPISAQLRNHHRLVILPDGPLHNLPFAALSHPGLDDSYLAGTHQITIADSMTTFHQLHQKERETMLEGVRWVGFGPPHDGAGSVPNGPERRFGFEQFLDTAEVNGSPSAPLPYGRLEIEQLARRFEGSSLAATGARSTEALLRAQAHTAEILHFACHGVFEAEDPDNSALILAATPGARDFSGDGRLTAAEITALELNASLVVLSACESGLGTDQNGEGARSLARAFRFAGARSVLASLWRVSDYSTTELMRRFYRHLLQGNGASRALCLAQRDLLRGGRLGHPYYWAAFQLTGCDLPRVNRHHG